MPSRAVPAGDTLSALPEGPESQQALRHLEAISTWMDRRYLDPLIGFFLPGAGDTLGSLVGLYGIYVALRLKAHPIIIARMLLNLGVDALVGAIPLLGAIFDIFYRAHVRNLELLKTHQSLGVPRARDWFLVAAAAGLLLFAIALVPILIGLFTMSVIQGLG